MSGERVLTLRLPDDDKNILLTTFLKQIHSSTHLLWINVRTAVQK